MKISVVKYDRDSKEAEVLFENDNQSLLTYCPFLMSNKLPKHIWIEAFLPSNCRKTFENESIEKNSGYYSFSLIGKVKDIKNDFAIVSVFGIEIKVDNIPSDINTNENLYFETIRLDCICE